MSYCDPIPARWRRRDVEAQYTGAAMMACCSVSCSVAAFSARPAVGTAHGAAVFVALATLWVGLAIAFYVRAVRRERIHVVLCAMDGIDEDGGRPP